VFEVSEEVAAGVVCDMLVRGQIARAAGGIPAYDVKNGATVVPEGWWLCPHTLYFLPPTFSWSGGNA
jgi:hypothetical protein